ncbi:MAG: Hsp20 family protein [Pseudomonadota bacterium]|nr:Hsp20 family protein [Pseudomonadota bacterium]
MRTFDFAPLSRSSVGFDRLFDLLEDTLRFEPEDHFPPYNIERTGEDVYRIVLAVAGYTPDEITITAQQNMLTVAGRKAEKQGGEFFHRGISGRAFERRFSLADHVKVTNAGLENGLLVIELVREVPEAMKPRRIEIGSGTKQAKQIEHKA